MIGKSSSSGHIRELPFRQKLTLITMAVTAVALLMSCFGLIVVQYSYERGKVDDLNRQLAEVLASNLGAAVVFQDAATADTIIHSARIVPNVLLLQARDDVGEQISLYVKKQLTRDEIAQSLAAVNKRDTRLFGDIGSYATPIRVNGEAVGSLVIGYQYRTLGSIVADTAPVAIVLFLVCLAIGFSVSDVLKDMVFQPLDRLTESMQAVRLSGNLEDRVEPSDDPDFDKIIASYNTMLGEIEIHTSQLSEAMDQLAIARDAAEEANTAKSAFLANMSHELRTPLNAIIGYAEVLRDDLIKAGFDRSVEDIGWIYSSSMQLLELINSLLDLSKIEAGRMDLDLHRFDLRQLLAEVEATLQPLAAKQSNQLEVSIEKSVHMVESDSTKLRQCLYNLGSNACKFTEHGHIRISAHAEQSLLVLEVSDTGIGISQVDIAQLFQPFVQTDSSTTRSFGGTGLGLAIVKRFTEMLGGTVEVHSDVGFGTTFTLRIPNANSRALPEPSDRNATRVTHRSGTRERQLALVMESEPSAVELLRRLLERNGYDCLVASDGRTGLDLARQQAPDIVLLEINIPILDGWAVLDAFADDKALRAIPTVVVSVDDRKHRSIERGASEHLVKPINTDDLEAILRFRSEKRSGKILLVENDPVTARLYENGLVQFGYEVVHASKGEEAIAALGKQAFTLVVTDLDLPRADGFRLVERIARLDPDARPPMIVLTNRALEEEEKAKIQNHTHHIHLKSTLTPRLLANRISALLNA